MYDSFVFMEFKTVEDAMFAISAMHGHPFDAKHTFLVNRFTDIEKYQDVDEVFVPPEAEVYEPRVCLRGVRQMHGSLNYYLGTLAGVVSRSSRKRSICDLHR